MSFVNWTPAIALFMYGTLLQSANGEPIAYPCDFALVEITANSKEDGLKACKVAKASRPYFEKLGLMLTAKIRLEITEDFDIGPGQCVALFDTEQDLIQVLPPHCLEGNPGRLGPFPQLSTDVLFEGLIIHELTHAYLDHTAGERFIPRIAHEYLAHAIQIEHLSKYDREQILQEAAISELVELDEINEAVLNFAPLRFAAKSWLHFKKIGADAGAVERLIEGDLSFESFEE